MYRLAPLPAHRSTQPLSGPIASGYIHVHKFQLKHPRYCPFQRVRTNVGHNRAVRASHVSTRSLSTSHFKRASALAQREHVDLDLNGSTKPTSATLAEHNTTNSESTPAASVPTIAKSTGRCSLPDLKGKLPLVASQPCVPCENAPQSLSPPSPSPASRQFADLWKRHRTPNKIDLSHWNVVAGELQDNFATSHSRYNQVKLNYGNHNTPRRMAERFLIDYYDLLVSDKDIDDQAIRSLMIIVQQHVQDRSLPSVNDLFDFSWVLSSPQDRLVQRFLALSDFREQTHQPHLPLWLILQITRSTSFSQNVAFQLLHWIIPRLSSWSWTGNSAILLTARLIRRARLTAPQQLELIIECFTATLDERFAQKSPKNLRLLTHWCNRVLNLLSASIASRPFIAVRYQQAAQLDLLRYMQDSIPTVPITREGYRALAKVQSMHAKTEEERDWANAKASTWPPWEERHKMGAFSAPTEYPGKKTRVLKVLDRMTETGYATYEFESSMKILAGWDTDKSPTIQVARSSAIMPFKTLWKPGNEAVIQGSVPIWTARVEATRSVREAWMVFCSYTTAVPANAQSNHVYFAMFRKLLAPSSSRTPSGQAHLPGDGLETFPDPDLARDQVYIPQPVPSPIELFTQMRSNDIKPSLRLTTFLLKSAPDLNTGLHYLSESTLRPESKEPLVAPADQSIESMARVLDQIPTHLAIAYVGLLARPHVAKLATRSPLKYRRIRDPTFIGTCIKAGKRADVRVWNSFFTGLIRHTHVDQSMNRRLYVIQVVEIALDLLSDIQNDIQLNFETFTILAPLIFDTALSADHMQHLFMSAAHGHHESTNMSWAEFCTFNHTHLKCVPSGDAIELMAWLLGAEQSSQSIADLVMFLGWVHRNHQKLVAVDQKITKHNLAVFRLFFEGLWTEQDEHSRKTVQTLPLEELQNVQNLIHDLAGDNHSYPDNEYMMKYVVLASRKCRNIQKRMNT